MHHMCMLHNIYIGFENNKEELSTALTIKQGGFGGNNSRQKLSIDEAIKKHNIMNCSYQNEIILIISSSLKISKISYLTQ